MWLQKIKIVVVFILIFFITACGSRALQNGKEFNMQELNRLYSQNRVISASAPSKLNPPFIGYYRFDEDFLDFSRTIPNMLSENIRLNIYPLLPQYKKLSKRLLNKKTNKEFDVYWKNLQQSKEEIKNNKERGVEYHKLFTDYIDGIKCASGVESQSMLVNGVGARNYWTTCIYYAKNGKVKLLRSSYRYNYTYNETTFQNSNTPSLRLHKLKEIQNLFKKDIKEIFNSIKIHDMDRVKMKKEGLLYDRKHEIQEY